jgi:hypothetical protein
MKCGNIVTFSATYGNNFGDALTQFYLDSVFKENEYPNNTVNKKNINTMGGAGSVVQICDENCSSFTINSIRVYDRILNLAEIEQNVALDKLRYLNPPTVTIGGNPCTNVSVISPTEIRCIAPPGTAGETVNVTVTARDGSDHSDTLNADTVEGYTYVTDVADDNNDIKFYVFSQSKNHGANNEPIKFTGDKFEQITDVEIGGVSCKTTWSVDTASTPNTLICTIPDQTD